MILNKSSGHGAAIHKSIKCLIASAFNLHQLGCSGTGALNVDRNLPVNLKDTVGRSHHMTLTLSASVDGHIRPYMPVEHQ